MNKLKEIGLPGGNFFEFVLFHLTPAGWRLKKLEKEGYLEFRRDKETGRIYVHPTEKTATLMAMRGVESCLECLEKPQVKSMRHHNFLTGIAMKLRESGYSDFRINPMCPHRPERNLGADAVLTIRQTNIAIFLETTDTEDFPFEVSPRNFDGILVLVEGNNTARVVVAPSIRQKICFVELQAFLQRGMNTRATILNDAGGETVQDFLRFIQTIVDSKN